MTRSALVYIFGDQSENYIAGLRCLLQSPQSDQTLRHFLTQSYEGIIREISQQSYCPEYLAVHTSSLRDLLSNEAERYVPLQHALATLYHFAAFIHRCHQSEGVYVLRDHPATYLIGLCTGSLAAATISCLDSLVNLLPVAVDVVRLSFRVGAVAANIARAVAGEGKTRPLTWALGCAGLLPETADAVIKTLVRDHTLPDTARPYISSLWPGGITVSGPPEILSLWRSHPELSAIRTTWLPVYAPYHAAHLYSEQYVDHILQTFPSVKIKTQQVIPTLFGTTVQSPATSSGADLRTVLRDALHGIYCQPMELARVPQELQSILAMSDITSVKVIPIASSQAQRIIPSLQGVDVHIQSDLLGNSNDSPSGMSLGASAQGPRFALVGMAGRFPNAEDTSAFWDLILQGLDVHRVVPDTRWDPHTHVDPSGQRKNTSQTGFGCWLDRPELFDARFFGISPREAEQMDPAQRLALMTAYEAMEDGGIVADRTPSTRRDRMGVIYGVTSNDWMETNSAQNIDTYFIPGGNRAFIPGRVNYCFKLGGPGFSVDTACSSSLAALHIACNMLRTREADTMLVGGTNVLTNPDFTSGLDRGHFLSRTGNCKTFDETADGYCRGEGVVTLVIKRLEDALADRDPIRGVIANIATNHSAEAASITKPHVQNQAALFRHVLDGISPADISYVEMHGTGTQAGDTCEMAAVSTVLAPGEAGQCRSPSQPLYVGAVKSNVGHGEAVAGACSLVKALLMMEHGTIPPHAGIKTTINHEFPSDLFDRGIRIARQPVPWNRPARGLRRVLVNNFSAAGGNTALLLEDGPIMDSSPRQDPRGTYIITLSARSATALQGNVRNLLRLLNDFEEQVPLPSLSYTTTARRMHHSYRAAVPASTIDALKAGLSKLLEPEPPTSTRARHPSIIFLFTGQASEYRGMGKALFDQVPSFRSDIIRHNQLACKLGFGSFLPVIRDLETDINAHTLPAVHLAIVCLQMALSSLLKTWGIQPRAVTGHSLGYYAALNAAGVLTEADTIFLVGSRSQLIERECEPVTHAMLAVKCSVAAINHLLADTTVTIACINGPEDVVLSGPQDAITRVRTRLATEAIYATPLALPYAFHSAQMEGILDDFRALAAGVSFRPPAIPLLCPLTGRVVTQPGIIDPGYLANHTRRRVDMVSALRAGLETGIIESDALLIEVGHHDNISRAVSKMPDGDMKVMATLRRHANDWTGLAEVVSTCYMMGLDIQWTQYHRGFESHLVVLPLPAYSWDLKPYWIQYVHDWSLRKGDPCVPQHAWSDAASRNNCPSPACLPETALVHRVTVSLKADNILSMTCETDLSNPRLRSIITGHVVNGIPVCTPAIYCDIALTLGAYIRDVHYQDSERLQIEVADMSIDKALVPHSVNPHTLRTTVDVDVAQRQAHCGFVTDHGEEVIIHATCTLVFVSPVAPYWAASWKAEAFHTQSTLGDRASTQTQSCYRFNKMMVYRMVGPVAVFDSEYQGLDNVILDSEMMAATGQVYCPLAQSTDSSSFHIYPPLLDAFTQLAGFAMNVNIYSDLESEVYVNHGWRSLQIFTELLPDRTYRGTVKLRKKEKSSWEGTLYLLYEDRLVCRIDGLILLGVPKRLLNQVLSSAQRAQQPALSAKTTLDTDKQELDLLLDSPGDRHTKVLDIISEESGISRATLNNSTTFMSIGIDSLLSLLITAHLRDEIGFDLGPRGTIFDHYQTVGELQEAVEQYFTHDGSENATPFTMTDSTELAQPCTSIVLHSVDPTCSTPHKYLFLFPDGSGSAHSYARLPCIDPSVTTVGLVCPYRTNPDKMLTSCTLDALIASYLHEIRRRQPHGPYSLGGWSAGGILAYRAAQTLLDAGEPIAHLFLLDSPPPQHGLSELPEWFLNRLSKHTSTFLRTSHDKEGSDPSPLASPPPAWLHGHFRATIHLLHDYHAQPLLPRVISPLPKVTIIWAKKPVPLPYSKDSTWEQDDGVAFLTERRTDLSTRPWADLFPAETDILAYAVDADHFSMMEGSMAELVSRHIRTRILGAGGSERGC